MPTAAIDLGSNSCLLLVLGDDGDVRLDQALVVGLGRGLGDGGRLAEDRRHAALEVLATYAARAQHFGVPPEAVVCVATSACRRAVDAEDFLTEVQRATGLRFRVAPGEVEARLAWRGASAGWPGERVLVMDVGGGSTELAWGRVGAPEPEGRVSLEVGSVRLTEAFLGTGEQAFDDLERAAGAVRQALAGVVLPDVDHVVGVAGTVVTFAAMAAGHATWRPGELHGLVLDDETLADLAGSLVEVPPEARRLLVPAAPDRADYLAAGGAIAMMVLAAAGRRELVVSTRDLRHGAIAARADGDLPEAPDRLRAAASRE